MKHWTLVLVCLLGLSGCFVGEELTRIPGAENSLMTHDGRLFVVGSQGLYAVTRDTESTKTESTINNVQGKLSVNVRKINTTNCQFLGLAEMHGWLFSTCAEKLPGLKLSRPYLTDAKASLWAYSLRDDTLIEVAPLQGFSIPNGMGVLAASNQLLIADENFFGQGGVTRLTLDFSGETPRVLDVEPEWIGAAQGVSYANGLKVVGNDVFLTEKGSLKKITLESGEPAAVSTLYSSFTILDDLAPYCKGVVATDFLQGRLVYVSADGTTVRVSNSGFHTPSSVIADASPIFAQGTMLVTELRRFSEKQSRFTLGRLLAVSETAIGLGCE